MCRSLILLQLSTVDAYAVNEFNHYRDSYHRRRHFVYLRAHHNNDDGLAAYIRDSTSQLIVPCFRALREERAEAGGNPVVYASVAVIP